MIYSSPTSRRRRLGVAVVAAVSASAGWAIGQAGRDATGPAPAAPVVVAFTGSDPARDAASVSAAPLEADATSCDAFAIESDVVDPEALELALTYGAGSERYDALVQALEAGVEMPPELLWQTYATDLAEDLRLLALTTWADLVADDGFAVRTGLQMAASDASPAVRAEARHRLDELDRYERMRTETAAQALYVRP